MVGIGARGSVESFILPLLILLLHEYAAESLLVVRHGCGGISRAPVRRGTRFARAPRLAMKRECCDGRSSFPFRYCDRRFWRRKIARVGERLRGVGQSRRSNHERVGVSLEMATEAAAELSLGGVGGSGGGISSEVFQEGVETEGRDGQGNSDMGFEMSVWRSLGHFRRNVRETFLSSREMPDVGPDGRRYLASLVRSQAGVLIASVATLVLAAGCEVAVPHYSSKALNAAAFVGDRLEFARSMRGMIVFSMLASVFTGLRGVCFWLAGTHIVAKVSSCLRIWSRETVSAVPSGVSLFISILGLNMVLTYGIPPEFPRRRPFIYFKPLYTIGFDLLSSLLRQDIAFFDAQETGALTSRLASDTTKISNVVSFHVNILCRQVIKAIGGLGYLFTLERRLASVALVGLLAVGAITATYGRFSRRISAKVQSALAEAGSVAEQSLSLVRVVRAHSNEKHERRRYGRKIGVSVELQETQGIAYGIARTTIGWSQALLLAGVLLLGAGMVFDGRLAGQSLTTFVFYTNFVITASFDVGDQWAKIQEALGAGQKVFDLLQRQPAGQKKEWESSSPSSNEHKHLPETATIEALDKDAPNGGGVNNGDGVIAAAKRDGVEREPGRVEFQSVSFAYPTRPGVKVLDGLSVTVRPGEKVAVVGASGGGKSTILRLLCRFYDPDAGSISLGGQDLLSYDSREVSNILSWVTQEPQLFPISVRDNISYGLEEGSHSMDDIYEAAKAANVHSFVSGLPDGYDTLVGEGGASLSGGQKQRVAIARALIRDPEVLLLDEPTSALDVESERLVQEALDRASEGRSVILIAHRLATIQRADRILVMQDGRVVESGKHGDLLSLGGVYARLYKQSEKVATLS